MRWSVKLGYVAGIALYVHVTFSLLLLWVAWSYWQLSHNVAATVEGVLFVLSIFGCVVLHELGHALTARRYGIKTHDITLLPIGGVARLERMPDKPSQEFWVAVAGPAVNVVIAAFGLLLLAAFGRLDAFHFMHFTGDSFLNKFINVNIFILLFNLLPAFPMDGGRVLRALLAARMPHAKATRIAATIGQSMAILFGFVGIMIPHPILILIAIFVWMGASQESNAADIRSGLEGIHVRDAMITEFQTLSMQDDLGHAIDAILAGSQHDFPVMDNGRFAGLLTRNDLMVALARQGKGTPVADVIKKDVLRLDASDLMTEVLPKIQASSYQSMPVFDRNQLAGLLTSENIGEFLMIRSALGRR